MFCMASVYAFGKLQRSSPGQQTSPCSVCVITDSNFLRGVDLTSNTARTLHDSDQDLYNLNWGVSTLTCHPRVGRVVLRTSLSQLHCCVEYLHRTEPWAIPSVASELYTAPNSARSITSITVLLLWSDNSCAWFAVAATLTILPDTSVSSRFSFWMLAAYTTVGW